MKIGGLTSQFVPKGMSIELINCKKKIQYIVQPGRTSGMVAIGRSGSTTK